MPLASLEEYMKERYSIFLRRQEGEPWPWTDDKILQNGKFTNVFRKDDRTTKAFKAIYDQHKDANLAVKLCNAATFRYIGTSQFANQLGWQNYDLITADEAQHAIVMAARAIRDRGEKMFTGAYLIGQLGKQGPKEEVVTQEILRPLWAASSRICAIAEERNSWRKMVEFMQELPGFGSNGFMAKETVQDVILMGWQPWDMWSWSPCGPGARRGLNVVFGRPMMKQIQDSQALLEMRVLHARVMSGWPDHWPPLSLHDIQFSLCEWAKYTKVLNGTGRTRSNYRRPA